MFDILPYPLIVGQTELREALEVAYVGRLGVLATGQRGTAKSTTIRAFSLLVHNDLPVTLPIGVTDDRVLGGWSVEALLGEQPRPEWQKGLLARAGKTGMLYVDEINLLDDHIVNLVLDAAATGILTVQRDHADLPTEQHEFALVGSMNPDEGPLRPQLLDRFALVVSVRDEGDPATRAEILRTLFAYDLHRTEPDSDFMAKATANAQVLRQRLHEARERCRGVACPPEIIEACAAAAAAFDVVGHRGEVTMLKAAQARAALDNVKVVEVRHLRAVAKPALIHRRQNVDSGTLRRWGQAEEERLDEILPASQTG